MCSLPLIRVTLLAARRRMRELGGRDSKRGIVRYHPMLLRWAVAKRLETSKTQYEQLVKDLGLPSTRYVDKLRATLATNVQGFNRNTIVDMAQEVVHKIPGDQQAWARRGILSWDSMYVKRDCIYDPNTGALVGFASRPDLSVIRHECEQLNKQVATGEGAS